MLALEFCKPWSKHLGTKLTSSQEGPWKAFLWDWFGRQAMEGGQGSTV